MGRYEDLIRRGLYQYDKEALFELGEMYRDGVGVKQDLEEAERWFSKAKQLGHLRAERAIAALQTALPEPERLGGRIQWGCAPKPATSQRAASGEVAAGLAASNRLFDSLWHRVRRLSLLCFSIWL